MAFLQNRILSLDFKVRNQLWSLPKTQLRLSTVGGNAKKSWKIET
ncbi:hypothetical protein [Flavobacterium sp.]